MALPATDTFTGTNGTALGTYSASWSVVGGAIQIFSNAFRNDDAGFSLARWVSDTFDPDQYSQVVAVTLGTTAWAGPATRVQAGSNSGYGIFLRQSQVVFGRVDSGSFTALGSSAAISTNDVFKLESIGSNHKVYRNGVQDATIGTISDSTYTTGAAGICGLYTDHDTLADTWEGGNTSVAITSTGAFTNNNDRSAAAGSTTAKASSAYANANDRVAASGSTTAKASSSTINGSDTVVASGSVGALGTIAISTPVAYKVFPRTLGGTTGPMLVTGTYTGSPNHIQAQIVKHGTSTAITAWATIVASPSGGTFSGTLMGVPQTTDGSWYDVQVRSRDVSNTVIATANGSSKTGIGIVTVIAGQSNALGHANDTPTVSNDLAAFYNGSAWSQTDAGGSTHSVAPDLQNALIAKYNIPVGVSIVAQDGTNLYSDWARNGTTPTDPATLYGQLLNRITALSSVEAIFWLQGEADADAGRSQAQYESDLSSHIANLRSDMGYTVPYILNQLGNLTGSTTGDAAWQGIRNAQLSRDNGTNILVCTAHDLVLNADGVHFQSIGGFTLLGPRFSNALAFYLGGSAYYRGPAINSVMYTSGAKTAVDVTMTHRGGTDFTPTSGITGFVVLDGGTPATISSAVRQSATVVRLTLSGAVSGTGTLRYLYGKNPTVSGLVVDNTALALPMEGTSADATILAASINGTAAYTNTNDRVAASGSTTAKASAAYANGNDRLVAAGSTTALSASAAKNGNDSVSAAGSTTAKGSAATVNGNDTVVASGSTGFPTASASVRNGNDTVVAFGTAGSAPVPNVDGNSSGIPKKKSANTYKSIYTIQDRAKRKSVIAEVVEEIKEAVEAIEEKPQPVRIAPTKPEQPKHIPIVHPEYIPENIKVTPPIKPMTLPPLSAQETEEVRAQIQKMTTQMDDEDAMDALRALLGVL